MARYPFMVYVNDFMDKMHELYAPVTWRTVMRRYRRINIDMIALHRDKKIKTLSPKMMDIDDVHAYLSYRRSLNYTGKEYSHDYSAMHNLFAFVKNDAFDDCLTNYPLFRQYKRQVRLPPLDDNVYQAILSRASEIAPDDFPRLRAYALVLLCIRAGMRTKEIRLADVRDLDTKDWMMDIIHVKGEASYGEPRSVPLLGEIRPTVESYLSVRKKWLVDNNIQSTALFPSPSSSDGYMSSNSLRRVKSLVEKEIGVNFDFRTLRRTFGQQYLDAGADIKTVSVLMGHNSTLTTERNYARKRSDKAIKTIRAIWEDIRNEKR